MSARAITLLDTCSDELPAIYEMERGEACTFILPYSLERHQQERSRPDVIYKSIRQEGGLVGFVILVLDSDGVSVEFRRIVVSVPGHGIGKAAVELVRDLCKRDLGRQRVWLDVFDSNERARHVYESCGFSRFGSAEHDGRRLLLYEWIAS